MIRLQLNNGCSLFKKGAKMKKAFYITIVLIMVAVLAIGCTNMNTDLLTGGDFEYPDTASLQKDWTLKSGTADSNVFTVSNGTLNISTTTAGWAYAAQELKLKSNAYYKINYTFSINTMSYYGEATSYDGLYIGFLEDRSFNIGETKEGVVKPILHNGPTNTDVSGEIYLRTPYITSASLAIFVGSEENPVSATVRIRDISIERVKKSAVPVITDPETGKDVLSFFKLDTKVYGANSEKNIVFIVLGSLFTLFAGYAIYMMYRRNMAIENDYNQSFLVKLRDSKYLGLILVIAFTALIRLIISIIASVLAGNAEVAYLGYNVESQAAQGMFIAEYGTVYLKSSLLEYTTKFGYAFSAVESSPMLIYMSGLAGVISKLFGGGIVLTSFFLKLFAIAADVGVVVIIYSLLHNRTGKISAILMSALYAALPLVFSISAGWGLSESVLVFLITLTLYFILKNNYYGVAISYFFAFCFSTNAIYMLPIVLIYVINQFITRKKLRLPIILSVLLGFGLFYAVTVPINYLDIQGGKPFEAVTDYYNAVLVNNNVYTANAFNFQAVLKNNFETVTTESLFITILFDVFVIALVAVGYFKNKNRMELTLLGALLVAMLFTFTNRMTPVTMYMALPLMFIYAAMNKEKRVFAVSIAYAILMFVNASYVYMVTGYSASGIEALTYDTAIMYVFGSFNILVTCYFIYVVYDIVATRKASRIKPMEVTYIKSLQIAGRRVQKFFYSIKTKLFAN